MQPAIDDSRRPNPSSSTFKWILGLGAAAFAVGGTVLAARSAAASSARRAAARVSPMPEPEEYVWDIPDVSIQAARDWMEREWPGAKSCYLTGRVSGSARQPDIGFQLLYEVYKYTGEYPGAPLWIAAYAWRSPHGSGSGTPGSQEMQPILDQIQETINEGSEAWMGLSADVRGSWEHWSDDC